MEESQANALNTTTEVDLSVINITEVVPTESRFNCRFRLVIKFYAKIASESLGKKVNNRIYYSADSFENYLPARSLEFQNAIVFNRIQSGVFSGETQLIFSDDTCKENQFIYESVFNGTFKHVFDLKHFPYDSQKFSIRITFWRNNEFDFLREYKAQVTARRTFNAEMLDQPDYQFKGYSHSFLYLDEIPQFVAEIAMERRPWHYFLSVSVALFFVVFLGLCTFSLAEENIADRLSSIITLLLSVIAIKFVVAADVPKIPNITSYDKSILLTFLFLSCSALLHTTPTHILTSKDAFFTAGLMALVVVMQLFYNPIKCVLKKLFRP